MNKNLGYRTNEVIVVVHTTYEQKRDLYAIKKQELCSRGIVRPSRNTVFNVYRNRPENFYITKRDCVCMFLRVD